MTQEDKELLIKDICGRLPYGVKVQYEDGIFDIDNISSIYEEIKLDTVDNYTIDISEIKPYLRPMSSMTGVEILEYLSLKESIVAIDDITYFFETYKSIDWLNKNMFDYRGLIPMRLAIDATGLNVY